MVNGTGRCDATEPTALYRIFDSCGKLLYVGISCNAAARMAGHAAENKRWWRQVAEIKVEWLPNRAVALDAERAAIASENPVYNRSPGNGLGPDEPHRSIRVLLRRRMCEAEINIRHLRNLTRLDPDEIFDVLHGKGPPNDAHLEAVAFRVGLKWQEIAALRDQAARITEGQQREERTA